jgi:hypothetical protein
MLSIVSPQGTAKQNYIKITIIGPVGWPTPLTPATLEDGSSKPAQAKC